VRETVNPRDVRDVLDTTGLRAVFQPIVDLDSGGLVGYEALTRGPHGTALEAPSALFASARSLGLLGEVDRACRAAAFRGALRIGVVAPLVLFVNIEPEALDASALDELASISRASANELQVVFEVTERNVADRPAELLRTVERIREHGWRIALDDVGTDNASLAFMPLLQPEVVKLDLRLVQQRPGREAAEIMHAVGAYAEESGARVLAEGIETDAQLAIARGLGAQLGQGWLFGKPADTLSPLPIASATLPAHAPWRSERVSPFSVLPAETPLRVARKDLLIELSKKLEREALAHGEAAIVIAAFQHVRHFTTPTARRYAALAETTSFVCALGAGLPEEIIPGVRGAPLASDDPLLGEWDIVVLTPHFAAALLARDLGDNGADLERRFEYALTYRRATVVRAAAALISRVTPQAARLLAPTTRELRKAA
jgi:EAL domain-containing protein (putative c-di-GMP-specific phosphodiesterase class I)/DICT domain-containing protein